MDLKSIFELVKNNGSTILIVITIILSMVEVSKIPLNPWKWIGKCLKYFAKTINNAINEDIYTELKEIKNNQKDLDDKINSVNDSLDSFKTETKLNVIKDKRRQILRFYNECYRGIDHNREEFNWVRNVYNDYERMLNEMGMKNGEIDDSYSYIMSDYYEHEKNHSFTH